MFFSICIPQYRRPKHLIKILESFERQSFRDFEVCISDDGSPDLEFKEIESWLKKSNLDYFLSRHKGGLKYDKNLRKALSFAQGTYCLMMGNDDALFDSQTLDLLYNKIISNCEPEAIITNYCDWASAVKTKRIPKSKLVLGNPIEAAMQFRNQAFVSGLVLKKELVVKYSSNCVDGSEMYQMFLFAAIISSSHKLLLLSDVIVKKDVLIEYEQVDSYVSLPEGREGYQDGLMLPMLRIFSVVIRGIKEGVGELSTSMESRVAFLILRQLYVYTYCFWLVEYRRIGRFSVAAGLAVGMNPFRQSRNVTLNRAIRLKLLPVYIYAVMSGLLIPIPLFTNLKHIFFRIAKRQ